MKKEGIKIILSNRFLYTILSLISLVLVAILVQAYGTSNPSNFGHTLSEVASPGGCASNQLLLWNGSAWICTNSLSNLNVTNLNGVTINTTNLDVSNRISVTNLTVTNLNVTNTTNIQTTSANWSSVVGDPTTKFSLILCSQDDSGGSSSNPCNLVCNSGWTLITTSSIRSSSSHIISVGLCVKN